MSGGVTSAAGKMLRELGWQRQDIEALIDGLILLLDAEDGEPDMEDGDVDCCPAADDEPATSDPLGCAFRIGWGGDPMDAEKDDDDYCQAEDGPAWLRA